MDEEPGGRYSTESQRVRQDWATEHTDTLAPGTAHYPRWLIYSLLSLEKTLMLGGIGGRRRRGWQRMRWLDGVMTRWTWVSVNSGSWWWTGRPGVLWFMGSQRVGQDWATNLIWSLNDRINSWFHFPFLFLLMGKLRTRCHKWIGLERKSGDNVKSGLSLYSEHPYVNIPVSHSRLYKCMD